jgi:outer membrane protein OmpA-like peptidoglycan-associated protein
MSRVPGSAIAAGLLLAAVISRSPPARANDTWFLVGETAAGLALSEPQRSLFGPGGSAVLAGYRSLGQHAMAGLRLRGGLFADAGPADPSRLDPGVGGLGALSFALRLTPLAQPARAPKLGFWMEVAGGGGLTGRLARPVIEGGVGVGFRAGASMLGPSIRYLQVVQSGPGLGGADAKVALFGLEVALYDRKKAERPFGRMALQAIPPPLPSARDADGDGIADVADRCPEKAEDGDAFQDDDGCPEEDNDGDHLVDGSDTCPDEAEVVNGVDDEDGCPDKGGLVEVIDDRVVLNDEVIFTTERARVTSAGQRLLAAIVELWKNHPEWERIEVEGHADARGPETFNQWLSEERAQRVRAAMIRLGAPEDRISARGFGSTRPRTTGRGEPSLWRNRRVELVVIRKAGAP